MTKEIIDNSPNSVIYAIFDSVSQTNIQYFDSCNDDTAIRLVKQFARDPKSFLYQQRKDLTLYRLFEYAPKTGESVFNRQAIFALSALPEYDESPFGLDKLQGMLETLLHEVAELKKDKLAQIKLHDDNERLIKQARISFIDKLFKNNKEIN